MEFVFFSALKSCLFLQGLSLYNNILKGRVKFKGGVPNVLVS